MSEKYNPFQERWKTELSEINSVRPNGLSSARVKFEKEQREGLNLLLDVGPGDKVLEFGCGKARILSELSEIAELSTGLDISKEVLQLNRLNGRNLPFVQGDMFSQPFKKEAFDVVLSEGVIEHFNEWPDILKEAVRVLKPKGKLITAVPNLLNFPQTIALAAQGKNFRYYPEKPFYPGKSGALAKEYQKLGLIDLKFAGWRPGYFLESFYLFDSKTGEVNHPIYLPALRVMGKVVEKFVDLLPSAQEKLAKRWFGYEFVVAGIKQD